jgi:hypothetical protein
VILFWQAKREKINFSLVGWILDRKNAAKKAP